MNLKRSQEFYNTPNSPTTTESSSCHSVNLNTPPFNQLYSLKKDTPLTLENVARIQDADPSGTPLARYCLGPSPSYYTTNTRRKRYITSKPSRDNVLESPRILPFPYHNDSFFLPTAEHDHPGSSSMIIDSTSSIASANTINESQVTSIRRPSSSYQSHYRRQQISYTPHPQKRSRGPTQVTPESAIPEGVVSQKTHRGADRVTHLVYRFKNNFFRNNNKSSTTFNFNFKIDAFLFSKTFGELKNEPKKKNKLSWYEKLRKFFKKDSDGTSASGPVWHNQFKCNPTLLS